MKTMYTGCGVLTNDNVIDIWSAANQLQIVFLITECEKFVIQSLSIDNYEAYFYCSKLLSCQHVLKSVVNFMKTNFDTFTKTPTFLELTAEELTELIKSQDLRVSHEDVVVESILKWVDHEHFAVDVQIDMIARDGDTILSDTHLIEEDECLAVTIFEEHSTERTKLLNNKDFLGNDSKRPREYYLASLISASRFCHASIECKQQTIKHPNVNKEMVIKREVAYGIVRGLSEFWKSEELQDFTVTVGSIKFGCHKFLLAACSGFFRGLFRSGMKETELKCVAIKEISNKTFELILETTYTGCGVLTTDNVIDIWRAANQLQIIFLIAECEKFVIQSLSIDNYETYFCCAKLLSCQHVLKAVVNFMKRNFETLTKTPTFLELTADELKDLIKSQDLRVSHEDIVVESILRWVDHDRFVDLKDDLITRDESEDMDDNVTEEKCLTITSSEQCAEKSLNVLKNETKKRSEYLVDLLSAARTCLAGADCLQKTLNHPKIDDNHKARNIIFKALLHNLQPGLRNGQWMSSAVYRNGQEFENVGVTCAMDNTSRLTKICVFSFTQNKWLELAPLPVVRTCFHPQCVNVNGTLNLFSISEEKLQRLILSGDTWETTLCSFVQENITNYVTDSILMTVTDKCLYIFKPKLFRFQQVDLVTNKIDVISLPFPQSSSVQHLAAYYDKIIIFYPEDTVGIEAETVVQCFDSLTQAWTRLNNLEGQAEKLTSFRNDHDTFILQTNGDMWRIVQPQSDVVDFEFVAKLWTYDWPLHGAVTYLDDLYIHGISCESHQSDPYVKDSLPGFFHRIVYLETEPAGQSPFVPAVVNKKHIKYN